MRVRQPPVDHTREVSKIFKEMLVHISNERFGAHSPPAQACSRTRNPGRADLYAMRRSNCSPPRVEAIMRATGLVSITLAIMVLAATDAGAASWCAFYTGKALGGSENCGFATIEQCLAQVRGLGGWCRPNPFPGTAFGTAGTWGSGPPRQSRGGYQSQ